ncbi:hypothetical protein Tco_0228912 [Tanacetum coccineum]
MLLAMKDEAGSNLKDEEIDFIVNNSYEDETLEKLTVALAKKAFKERENRYLEDIVDLEEKLSSHDRIVYKMGQSIQTIHMLEKTHNKVYDPFLKAGLGYQNPERLKKAIAAQPKMYHVEMLQKSIQIESHKSSTEHPIVNEFVIINIPEEDVEPQPNLPLQEIIILDPDDQPMWENAKIVAPTPNSAIVQPNVDDNFVINSTHLKMIWENKFDGYLRADPHDHIREFLAICDMFKYGETQSEAVKLLIFPLSLCDKAKAWFNELNEESITSWDHMRRKNMLRKCHGHGLTKGAIIQIFYHDLDESTQAILDVTARGIFLYKSLNQAFQFLDDKVLFELDWSNKLQMKPTQKFVVFANGSNSNNDNSRLMEKLEALTVKMDSQFQSLKEEMHEMLKILRNRSQN